jgi:hypothetical protein
VTFVLLLVSVLLVLVGVVTLIIGIFSSTLAWVYVSIGTTLAAGIVLYIVDRMSRQAAVSTGEAAPAAAVGGGEPAAEREPVSAGSPFAAAEEEAVFPIEEYDDLRVPEIMPLLPELDDDELETVRERELAGKQRASILSRIDELLAEGAEPAPAPLTAAVQEAPTQVLSMSDASFPIADYDDLKVAEILPLLTELEPDELEVVADRERQGANRATIINRINDRLGGRAATAKKAASAAKGARGAAKKAGGATKAAGSRAGGATKAGATKAATAAKSGGAKKAAKAAASKATRATKATKAGKKTTASR